MTAKKKRGSGGALLLKTKGPEYFSDLAKKGAEKRKKALELWNKMNPKPVKSVKVPAL